MSQKTNRIKFTAESNLQQEGVVRRGPEFHTAIDTHTSHIFLELMIGVYKHSQDQCFAHLHVVTVGGHFHIISIIIIHT